MKCEYCDSYIADVPHNGICPNCGGVLRGFGRRGAPSAEKLVCPNCGAQKLDGKKCAFCGTQLIEERLRGKNTLKGDALIPTSGGYMSMGRSLVLSDSGIRLCVPTLFRKERTQIPYDRIAAVVYSRPYGRGMGALLFRSVENRQRPIPKREKLHTDALAIPVTAENDLLFYHIFQMLKTVAPPAARFEMLVSYEDAGAQVDMEYFFDMYAPHRARAAGGIAAKHEIPPETARALVDRYFDDRQAKQYAADPVDAIRDLNLVVEDMRREERRQGRVDAQQRARQEREARRASWEEI